MIRAEVFHLPKVEHPRSRLLAAGLLIAALCFPTTLDHLRDVLKQNVGVAVSLTLAPIAISSLLASLGNAVRSAGKDREDHPTMRKGEKIISVALRLCAAAIVFVIGTLMLAAAPAVSPVIGFTQQGLLALLATLPGLALSAFGVAEVLMCCLTAWQVINRDADCLR